MISQVVRDAHNAFMDRPEWAKGYEWREILNDGVWSHGYLPYNDEPVRCSGAAPCHRSPDTGLSDLLRRLEK